ncbi:MAG: hypothetical protein AAF485_10860 [Chloroflexota bacterium]
MEINWTVLTYFVIGLFLLNGFYRGWWKEAVTTAFLGLLVFFLKQPGIAGIVVGFINTVLETIWAILSGHLKVFLTDLFETGLGIRTGGSAIQIDPSDPGTWLMMMLLFMMAATLLSRSSLPNHGQTGYAVKPVGGLLGGLIGGLNGFIVINLVREYLDGRNLPINSTLPSEIVVNEGVSASSVGITSPGVGIQAVELPDFTILDSFLPWIIILIAVMVFIAAFRSRVALVKNQQGFRKVEFRQPYGYEQY